MQVWIQENNEKYRYACGKVKIGGNVFVFVTGGMVKTWISPLDGWHSIRQPYVEFFNTNDTDGSWKWGEDIQS